MKKLKLRKTTLRQLSPKATAAANGGTQATDTCYCHTYVCYPIDLTDNCSNWCGITDGNSCTCTMREAPQCWI